MTFLRQRGSDFDGSFKKRHQKLLELLSSAVLPLKALRAAHYWKIKEDLGTYSDSSKFHLEGSDSYKNPTERHKRQSVRSTPSFRHVTDQNHSVEIEWARIIWKKTNWSAILQMKPGNIVSLLSKFDNVGSLFFGNDPRIMKRARTQIVNIITCKRLRGYLNLKLHIFICIYIHIDIHICICIYVYIYVYIRTFIYIHICIYIYIYIYTYVYICIIIHTYMHIRMYMYINVSIRIYHYIYLYACENLNLLIDVAFFTS